MHALIPEQLVGQEFRPPHHIVDGHIAVETPYLLVLKMIRRIGHDGCLAAEEIVVLVEVQSLRETPVGLVDLVVDIPYRGDYAETRDTRVGNQGSSTLRVIIVGVFEASTSPIPTGTPSLQPVTNIVTAARQSAHTAGREAGASATTMSRMISLLLLTALSFSTLPESLRPLSAVCSGRTRPD